jgi:hypothetical protein
LASLISKDYAFDTSVNTRIVMHDFHYVYFRLRISLLHIDFRLRISILILADALLLCELFHLFRAALRLANTRLEYASLSLHFTYIMLRYYSSRHSRRRHASLNAIAMYSSINHNYRRLSDDAKFSSSLLLRYSVYAPR